MKQRPLAYSYARLSTTKQLDGDGLRRQSQATEDYCKAKGLDLQTKIEDIGKSAFRGSNAKDGKLAAFLQEVQKGTIPGGSYFIIESIDRLSRQPYATSFKMLWELVQAKLNVVTLIPFAEYTAENINDLNTLITHVVVSSRAYEESKTKSTRGKATWRNKRANANSQRLTSIAPAWLRPSYDRKCFSLHEPSARTIREIFRLSQSGFGAEAIACRFNRDRETAPRRRPVLRDAAKGRDRNLC